MAEFGVCVMGGFGFEWRVGRVKAWKGGLIGDAERNVNVHWETEGHLQLVTGGAASSVDNSSASILVLCLFCPPQASPLQSFFFLPVGRSLHQSAVLLFPGGQGACLLACWGG